MKSALILFAISIIVGLGIVLSAMSAAPPEDRVFTVAEQITTRETYPGGKFVKRDTEYRRCERDGELAKQGFWVYYERSGRRAMYNEGCWR